MEMDTSNSRRAYHSIYVFNDILYSYGGKYDIKKDIKTNNIYYINIKDFTTSI